MRYARPRRPAIDAMLTMAPRPASIMAGTAKRVQRYELVRHELIVYSQSSNG